MTLEAVKRGAVSPGPVAAEMLGTGRHEAGHTRGKGRRPARGSLARDRPQLRGGLELTCAAPCAGNGRRNPSCFLRFNFQKGREEHQRTPNPALRRRSRLTQLLQESCFSSTSAEARQGTWPQMAVTQRFQIKNHKKKKQRHQEARFRAGLGEASVTFWSPLCFRAFAHRIEQY